MSVCFLLNIRCSSGHLETDEIEDLAWLLRHRPLLLLTDDDSILSDDGLFSRTFYFGHVGGIRTDKPVVYDDAPFTIDFDDRRCKRLPR